MKMRGLGLVVLVLLAGCTDPGTDDRVATGGPGGSDGHAAPASGPAVDAGALPVWHVGDWWSYDVAYESGESYTARILVYAEDATHYYLTSDDRDLILRAAFTHYPTFGAVAKHDLSQTIHGVKVESLRFPLANGTWSGTYRDFPATWTATAATIQTGKGPIDGFITTMQNADDGRIRIANGWSSETKWYTNFTFNFDGEGSPDVTYTLRDWGSNHTGSFPIVETLDNVHRPFPTLSVAPSDPTAPPPLPSGTDALDTVGIEDGSSILWGFFAGTGGLGFFRMQIGHESSGAFYELEWRPDAAGGVMLWEEIETPDAGQWGLSATGVAQSFAFLFVEAYEARTTSGTL